MLHRYLILGLLMDGPMSGYDIKKRVNTALGIITNASYGTLYPTLHKLLAEDAVQVQVISQTGRPSKKVYRVTNRGRQEFLDWLKRPASTDKVGREFLLRLYLAQSLSDEEVRGLLSARRDELERLEQTFRADMGEVTRPQERWVVDYALAMVRAEVEWLQQMERHIGQVPNDDNLPENVKQMTA